MSSTFCCKVDMAGAGSALRAEEVPLGAGPAERRFLLLFSHAFLVETEAAALDVEETVDRVPPRSDAAHAQPELRLVELSAASLLDGAPDLVRAVGEGKLEPLPEYRQRLSGEADERHERARGAGGL